jgi:hypothetical protein
LPRGLTAAEVERLLAGCDRGTAAGLRDYAVLSLLARLGLRGAEAAGLQLGDIDWRAGEIAVTGKGSRTERLPLPALAGEALAAWLTGGRPACESRAVFVTVRRPYRQLTPEAVRAVMGRACDARRVYMTTLLMVTGFTFLSRLTQIAQPSTRFVFPGAGVRPGLPSHPASRRRSCLRPGVSTTSSPRGLSPPIDRPCRAYSRAAPLRGAGSGAPRAGLCLLGEARPAHAGPHAAESTGQNNSYGTSTNARTDGHSRLRLSRSRPPRQDRLRRRCAISFAES